MEVVLIYRPVGAVSPEALKATIELGKQSVANPERAVPGGKLIAAYWARSQWFALDVWDVPTIDVLMPMIEQSVGLGFNVELIPVEKQEAQMAKVEKALESFPK